MPNTIHAPVGAVDATPTPLAWADEPTVTTKGTTIQAAWPISPARPASRGGHERDVVVLTVTHRGRAQTAGAPDRCYTIALEQAVRGENDTMSWTRHTIGAGARAQARLAVVPTPRRNARAMHALLDEWRRRLVDRLDAGDPSSSRCSPPRSRHGGHPPDRRRARADAPARPRARRRAAHLAHRARRHGPPARQRRRARALWQACRALPYGCPDCPEPRPVAAFTRDSAHVGLCAEHLEQAELDNEHADRHHTTEPHPVCGACQAPQA